MPQHNTDRQSPGSPEGYPAHAGHHPVPISDPLCRSVANKGRGGRRPGAGAPKGNLNALKHGRRSRQFAELGAAIAAVPEAQRTLNAYDKRSNATTRRAEEEAARRMIVFYQHCKDIAEGKPSPGPFQALAQLNAELNERPKALSAAQSKKEREILNAALEEMNRELQKIKNSQTNNRPVPQQSDTKYETTPD